MLDFMKSFNQGWYLTTLSSILCALGTFIIFLDDIYKFVFPRWLTRRYPFHLKENYSFMNGSLAFSSGCLLFTALYRLLPEAMDNLTPHDELKHHRLQREISTVLISSFIGGIAACFIFNQVLHLLTAESVVHCSHDGEDKIETLPYLELRDNAHSHGHGHGHGHSHSHSHGSEGHEYHEPSELEEGNSSTAPGAEDLGSAPLLAHRKSQGILHYFTTAKEVDDQLLGECKGYTSAELCLHDQTKDKPHFCEIPTIRKNEDEESLAPALAQSEENGADKAAHQNDLHDHQNHHDYNGDHNHDLTFARSVSEVHSHHGRLEHHHHHVNSPLSRLMLIGVQTILAITLHKFPEGFITYITAETDPQLGVSIFLSLLIHNFTEGFSMCLPLYYSFASGKAYWGAKAKAVSISAILGGLSQPLGALGGLIFLQANHAGNSDIDIDKLNYIFGITMAVTSGFLCVIALSMYGSAVSFSGSPNFVMIWCIVGTSIIGLLSLILKGE